MGDRPVEPRAAGDGHRRRVLVVDDDPVARVVIRTILDLEEFAVSTAADGEEALAIAAATPPDIVILEVMLPGVGGLEVCRRLKQDPATARVPVVLLTVRTSDEDEREGKEAGCDAYVRKPFSPLALIATLSGFERGS